jgi:dTDP-4-amino-4,6-dideoxygalactose transaminase
MRIPLVDLSLQYREIADEVRAGFEAVMESGAFILGPPVSEFEAEFARASGVSHCVGVGSGTDALELILRALDIGPGDEVVLPANTFIASALAVVRAGATPVLVDCDPYYYLIDVEQAAGRIGSRTRAIMPVNLFGQIAPMEALVEVATEAGVAVVEDAAQSHGARRHGRLSGSFGAAAGVSFYPSKNLGAYGDGGAVVTDDVDVVARVQRLRNWGSDQKYYHPEAGFNSRLDSLQAVVLRVKLKRLAAWNEARRSAASRYDEMLAEVPSVATPRTLAGNEHVWHIYAVRVRDRDRVLEKLHAEGIGAGVHYPIPIHLQGAFSRLGYAQGIFPEAERAAREMISLPLYPGIRPEQQERVVEVLAKAVRALG